MNILWRQNSNILHQPHTFTSVLFSQSLQKKCTSAAYSRFSSALLHHQHQRFHQRHHLHRSFSNVTTREKQTTTKKLVSPLKIVMDIDECMIHCTDADSSYRQDEERQEAQLGNGVESHKVVCEDGMPVHINIRPGLRDFLQTMVERKYHVYAFTAGLPVYARPVLDTIDPEGTIFQHAWYRSDCTLINLVGNQLYCKDLSVLNEKRDEPMNHYLEGTIDQGLDEKRTILVDNNIFSFIPQPANGVHIASWYDCHKDQELSFLLKLFEHLETVEDVRPILDKTYNIYEEHRRIIRRLQEQES